MNKNLKIDIVSDISCPWCIIGYQALNQALTHLAPDIQAEITWQPFELNPQMPKEGQDITEHITQKYGITVEQSEQNRAAIKERGLSVGYELAIVVAVEFIILLMHTVYYIGPKRRVNRLT